MEENTKMESSVNGKQCSKKKFLVIGIILAAVVIFSIFMLFGPVEYIRNKTFHNGIKGTYVCTDVIVPYTNETVEQKEIEYLFLDMECKVWSNGTIDEIFKDYTPKLEFSGDFIHFPLPLCATYDVVGDQPEGWYIKYAGYHIASRDKSIENNVLSFTFYNYRKDFFVVNFEEVDE